MADGSSGGDTVGTMLEVCVTMEDGVRIWTASSGSGPPLLLCHGGPGAFDTLEPLAALVDDVVTVHRWDQRGAGRSQRTGPYTISRFVADIECLREHFGYERWIVGGHSWGASLALLYAQSHPDRVDGVIYLAGTGLEWWPHYRQRYGRERQVRLGPVRAQRLADLAGRDRSEAEEREFRQLQTVVEFSDPARAELLAEQVVDADLRHEMNLEVNAAINAELKARPLADEVARCARVTAPVLIVDCAGDVRPVDATDSLAEALPDVHRVRLDTGHHPWMEQPDDIRSVLVNFLEAEVSSRETPETDA